MLHIHKLSISLHLNSLHIAFLLLIDKLAASIKTERGFIQVDEKMRVLKEKDGEVVPNLYCIGDANGKLMLAHVASAQVSESSCACNK